MIEIEPDTNPSLVVTGSSAGGIEALLAFLDGLPAGLGVPIVVAQHLDPTHASRLKEIFEPRSALPIVVIGEREALRDGTIYIVPPDRDVTVADGSVTAVAEARVGPKPSIDRLFESAAECYGERLIAIVFSGMGSDGLAGARLVKERGGTIIVQDPLTATHPSMPLAIPPALVDLTASPESMGQTLMDLVHRTRVPERENDRVLLRTLLTQLRDRSGIDFSLYKTPTILRRLSRLMLESETESLAAYMRYLEAHPDAYHRLASAFLIKVTEFFRDEEAFAELKATVLPRLIAEAAQRGGELRIWSAGTSTGEEAYSVAILCAELLRETKVNVAVRIFATDIDEAAIAFARHGVYSREAVDHLPQAYIDRYFSINERDYEVIKPIRNMTVFGQHDLGQRAPFPHIDLCLCRNVLIYFTRELQTRVLQLFAFALRDGGFLMLGKSETVVPLARYFRTISQDLKIFQRQGERILMPPARMQGAVVPIGDTLDALKDASRILQIPLPGPRLEPRPKINETIGTLIANSPVGVAIVDRRYGVISINAAARSMLQIHSVAIGEDLIHLVRTVDSGVLREMVDAAFRRELLDPRELRASDKAEEARWLRIACYSNRALTEAQSVDGVVLIVTDATDAVAARLKLEQLSAEQAARIATLTEHLDSLSSRQKSLLAANDELQRANDDLRGINEQLVIRSEEELSTHEEVETLNEEMQATNEELETLNEELQATIEELNTTNDELEVRAKEAGRLGELRDVQIAHGKHQEDLLHAVLSALAPVSAIVDDEGKVQFASPVVAGWITFAGERWWEHAGAVEVAGHRYTLSAREVEVEKVRYRVVLFQPAD